MIINLYIYIKELEKYSEMWYTVYEIVMIDTFRLAHLAELI